MYDVASRKYYTHLSPLINHCVELYSVFRCHSLVLNIYQKQFCLCRWRSWEGRGGERRDEVPPFSKWNEGNNIDVWCRLKIFPQPCRVGSFSGEASWFAGGAPYFFQMRKSRKSNKSPPTLWGCPSNNFLPCEYHEILLRPTTHTPPPLLHEFLPTPMLYFEIDCYVFWCVYTTIVSKMFMIKFYILCLILCLLKYNRIVH